MPDRANCRSALFLGWGRSGCQGRYPLCSDLRKPTSIGEDPGIGGAILTCNHKTDGIPRKVRAL